MSVAEIVVLLLLCINVYLPRSRRTLGRNITWRVLPMRCIQSIYPVPLWAYPFQSSASKYLQVPFTPVFQQLICFSFIVFLVEL